MPDPITSASQVVAEKVVTEAPKNPAATGGTDFAEVLNQRLEQENQGPGLREQILQAFGMSPQGNELQAVSAEGLQVEPARISAGQEIRTHGKVLELLTEVNRDALHMESLVDLVSSSKNMSPQSLLAVQANLAVTVMQMEFTKSIAEQGNNSFKAIWTTNLA